MNRVSTYGNYQSALLNLFNAQARGVDAQQRLATEKIATDLTGFGRTSETLTALKSSQTRVQGFIDTGEAVAARLTSQDLAFEQIADGALQGGQAISNALALGRLDGLMADLEIQFQTSLNGLNTQHQGRYVFSGGKVDTAPVDINTLSELAAAPDVASLFNNDNLKVSSRLDEGSTIETGFLASDVGSDLFQAFRDIQQYQQGLPVTVDGVTYTPAAAGTLSGQAGTDATTFLTAQVARIDAARRGIVDQQARNGSLQNRVDSVLESHEQQQLSLTELLGKKTDADLAKAATDLQLSDIAIQASAQVINSLRQVSLLNFLT